MMMVILVMMIIAMIIVMIMMMIIVIIMISFRHFLSDVLLSPEKWITRWSTPRAIHSTRSGPNPTALFAITDRLNCLCKQAPASKQASASKQAAASEQASEQAAKASSAASKQASEQAKQASKQASASKEPAHKLPTHWAPLLALLVGPGGVRAATWGISEGPPSTGGEGPNRDVRSVKKTHVL